MYIPIYNFPTNNYYLITIFQLLLLSFIYCETVIAPIQIFKCLRHQKLSLILIGWGKFQPCSPITPNTSSLPSLGFILLVILLEFL